jgi:hypothetical protein
VQETGQEEVNLTWSRSPYYYTSAQNLTQGDNTIKVKLTDASQTSAEHTLKVRLLTNTFEFINVQKPVETLNLNSGQAIDYPLKSEHVIDGNGLDVSVKLEDEDLLSVTASNSQNLKLTWGPNLDNDDILNIAFNMSWAVTHTINGSLNFYTCSRTGQDTEHCSKFTSAKVPKSFTFSRTSFIKIRHTLFCWGSDDKQTYTFAIPIGENRVYEVTNPEIAQDVLFLENNEETGFVVMAFKDTVEVFTQLYKSGYALVPQWTID